MQMSTFHSNYLFCTHNNQGLYFIYVGPTNYPFIGATSILSELGDVQKMLGWRPKYGEILSFYMLGQ